MSRNSTSVTLGRKLRTKRLELGLKQVELSAKTDIDRSYISIIETGKSKIRMNTLYKLLNALGLHLKLLIQ
jgi:transcriptional regulator with XRE-family HTH domain